MGKTIVQLSTERGNSPKTEKRGGDGDASCVTREVAYPNAKAKECENHASLVTKEVVNSYPKREKRGGS